MQRQIRTSEIIDNVAELKVEEDYVQMSKFVQKVALKTMNFLWVHSWNWGYPGWLRRNFTDGQGRLIYRYYKP